MVAMATSKTMDTLMTYRNSVENEGTATEGFRPLELISFQNFEKTLWGGEKGGIHPAPLNVRGLRHISQ